MRVAIGFDVGSSVIKLAAVRADGTVSGLFKAEKGDVRPPETLVRDFAASLDLRPGGIDAVVLTGVGAPRIRGDVAGIPTRAVNEFAASARGALVLTGKSEAVVASMGTGTALLRADASGARHLGGSGVGGGTLMGLCRKLYGLSTFEEVMAAAEGGDLDRVDLRIKDIAGDLYLTLPPDRTSSNFGKALVEAGTADMVTGFINMVLETVGVITVMACRGSGVSAAILIGSLTRLSQAGRVFAAFQANFGIEFVIPERAAFATAIGAALEAVAVKR